MDISLIVFVAILVFFVVIPGGCTLWKVWSLIKQQEKDCRDLSSKINTLTLAEVHDFSEPSASILGRVLTAKPGVGKPQEVPAALDRLAATMDAPLRTLRSLSYFAVLLGLLGTVFVLAFTFWGIKDMSGIAPALLGHVYSFNAIAILLAAVFYRLHISLRRRSDDLILTASQTLGRLQSEIPENVDPHLVAALEAVGRNFTQWGEEIYARHRQEAEELVREMRGLGDTIQGMVQSMIAARRTEEEGIIPLLRSQDEKIELLSQRLDARFRELAAPIQQTLPLIEQWQRRLEELGILLQTMLAADLPGNTEGLTLAAEKLTAVINELPQTVQKRFTGIKQLIAGGLQDAVKEGWQQTVVPFFAELQEALTKTFNSHQALMTAVAQLPEAVAEKVSMNLRSEWQATIRPELHTLMEAIQQVRQTQTSLEEAVKNMTREISHEIVVGVQPVVRACGKVAGQLADLANRLQVLPELPPTLAAAAQETLQHTGEALTAALSDTLQHLRQQLDSLFATLAAQTENSGRTLAEQITQGLSNALTAKGDSYLRDLVASLQQLQATIEKMGKETGAPGQYRVESPRRSWLPWR